MAICTIAQNCTINSGGTPAGQIFAQLVQTLISAQCALGDNSIYPRDRTSEILEDPFFDFIVVGAGTAGSIVASRLSEVNDWKILLVERGKDPSLMSRIPFYHASLLGTSEDYAYQAEPNSRYCQGTPSKRCIILKGKGLGGTSIINGMLHVHGNKQDYDTWSAMGNYGWSHDEVLPYFRKSENYHPDVPAKFGSKYFGVGGPVNIRNINYTFSSMIDIVMEAGKELGLKQIEVVNSPDYIGFGNTYTACDQGTRQDMARSFLSPVKNRQNLYVMKSVRADSVVIEDQQAVGVKVTLENGQNVELRASKEIILSAGSIVSPQLLMLSGIGPQEHLENLGIEVKADLPVGNNLKDHVGVFFVFFSYAHDSKVPLSPDGPSNSWYQYLLHRTGPFASNSGNNLHGFVNVNDWNSKYPNLQLQFNFIPKGTVHTDIPAVGLTSDIVAQIREINKDKHMFMGIIIVLDPKSTGKICLKSANPEDRAKIYPNYLENRDDLEVMMKGIQFLKNITRTKSFEKHGVRIELLDVKGCEKTEKDSREYWECLIRHDSRSTYHQVGTAKMGPAEDETSVVDPELRVHGIDGLRVIDASVMPKIPSGNTNSPTMMVAEKGSDMVKEEWLGECCFG